MRALIRRALSSPDYSLFDAVRFFRGQSFSSAQMWRESTRTNLFEQVPRIEVPVYFFTGRHDYNSPFEEADRYYRALDEQAQEEEHEAPEGEEEMTNDE